MERPHPVTARLQAQINGIHPQILGMIGAIAALALDIGFVTSEVSTFSVIVIMIDVLWGYLYGVAIGITIFAVWNLHRLVQNGHLKIRPYYPDNCSGLGAIGQLFQSLTLIIAQVLAFLVGWLILAQLTDLKFKEFFIQSFQFVFYGCLVVFVALEIVGFYLLVLSVHFWVRDQLRPFEISLGALGIRLAELEEDCVHNGRQHSLEQLKAKYEELDRLRSAYTASCHLPSWPINWRSLVSFASVKILPSILFITAALTLWEKLRSAL